MSSVIRQSGNPYDASKLRRRFSAAVATADVRRATFHELRHTFGTQMAAAGALLRAIKEWMGQRDHATLIYPDYALDPSQGAAWAERAFKGPETAVSRVAADDAVRLSDAGKRERPGLG